jgi:hypothetical protein
MNILKRIPKKRRKVNTQRNYWRIILEMGERDWKNILEQICENDVAKGQPTEIYTFDLGSSEYLVYIDADLLQMQISYSNFRAESIE